MPYPHNAENHGKADGTDCGQEACSGLRKKKHTSLKPRRIQSRKKKPPGRTQPDSHMMSTKDSRGRNKLWQSPLFRSSWKRCHFGAKRQSPKSVQARRKPCRAPSTTTKKKQQQKNKKKQQQTNKQTKKTPKQTNKQTNTHTQSSRTSNASSVLQWRSHRIHEQSQTPWDPVRQNADVQDAGRSNKTRVPRKDCPR